MKKILTFLALLNFVFLVSNKIEIYAETISKIATPIVELDKKITIPLEPTDPIFTPLAVPSCVISPIFCIVDDGDGSSPTVESMTINVDNYGANFTNIQMQPEDTWKFNFVAEKTEYYKFAFYSYPNTLSVNVKHDSLIVASGMTNDSYIEDSSGNDEYLLTQGLLYTITVVNDNNLTEFSVSVKRDDISTLKHPLLISSNSDQLFSVEYIGDIDYYKVYNTEKYLMLFSESITGANLDLESSLYLCYTSTCLSKGLFAESDNNITETNTLLGNMSVLDFGYDLDLTYYQNRYFLLVLSDVDSISSGSYNLISDAYSSRNIIIDPSNWVSEEMYPDESLFQLFTVTGNASGFDNFSKIGYYKYSYYAIGDNVNIYTLYVDWQMFVEWIDVNTMVFGVEYLHSDIYKYSPTTQTIIWHGALQPTSGDMKDVRLFYASDYLVSSLGVYDNASYTVNSYEDAIVAFTYNFTKSLIPSSVYIDAAIAAIESFFSIYETYTYQNMVFEYDGNFVENNDITIFQNSSVYSFNLFYEDYYYLRLGTSYSLPGEIYDLRTVHSKLQVTSFGESNPFYQINFKIDLSNSNAPYDYLTITYSNDGTYEMIPS